MKVLRSHISFLVSRGVYQGSILGFIVFVADMTLALNNCDVYSCVDTNLVKTFNYMERKRERREREKEREKRERERAVKEFYKELHSLALYIF